MLVVPLGLVTDGTQAQNAEQARGLWAYREGISESLSATGLPHKNDIALPISRLKKFCGELETLLAARYPGWELCLFGHIGDGNLHVNIMKPDALEKAAFLEKVHAVDADLMALVRSHAGSVSAEHVTCSLVTASSSASPASTAARWSKSTGRRLSGSTSEVSHSSLHW